MNINGWKFVKKKSGLFKKTNEKEKEKKKWSGKKIDEEKKKKKKKKVKVQFELYCVKLVELMIFEKKNYAPLVFRNYFVPYISFLHS